MKTKNWVNLFIALILFIPLGFIQVSIDYNRKLEDLESGLLLMPGQIAGNLVMSGFKGLAADLLWLNMETFWHSGQHYKMLPLLESVSWLQPRYITVWAVGGWHMAYNVYAAVKDPKEKQFWYNNGVSFLKKGIVYNPDKYDLNFELGWTYYHKGKDYSNAVRYFERAVKFPHPDYVDDVLAHAYEKNGQIKKAIERWEYVRDNSEGFRKIALRALRELKTKGKFTP